MKKHVKKILLSAALVLSLGSACFLNVFAGGGVVIPLSNGDHLVFDTVARHTYIVHESSESIEITSYYGGHCGNDDVFCSPHCSYGCHYLNGCHYQSDTQSLIIPKK